MHMWDYQLPPCLPGPPTAALPPVLSTLAAHLCHPTGLDECFFFNSLVVGLLYILIFWQFWLLFVLKFVVVLLLVVPRGKVCIYLYLHLGWNSELFWLHEKYHFRVDMSLRCFPIRKICPWKNFSERERRSERKVIGEESNLFPFSVYNIIPSKCKCLIL